MTRVIVDTGPIVAFLNRRDRHHRWVVDVLDRVAPPLLTCEAVLSEACFLLRVFPGAADAVLALVTRGIVECRFRLDVEIAAVRRLMAKYSNVPMSLADACVVRMSETERDPIVMTLDGDFRLYRRNRRQIVPVLMPTQQA